jgi:hypothetical protein
MLDGDSGSRGTGREGSASYMFYRGHVCGLCERAQGRRTNCHRSVPYRAGRCIVMTCPSVPITSRQQRLFQVREKRIHNSAFHRR